MYNAWVKGVTHILQDGVNKGGENNLEWEKAFLHHICLQNGQRNSNNEQGHAQNLLDAQEAQQDDRLPKLFL